ncbi:MAG TPA: serine/threonine-protein kinase, partial [Polyangiaceae bacterium]
HRAGIVHRDLKPSNLFLTCRADGTAQLKVLDFGIAKSLRPESRNEETLTGARTALGSPSYMSPEQVRNARQVDTRTDVWSLGVILYELLTGRLVFEASTFMAVSAAIVADTPVPPSFLRADIPAELERVVLRCLQKDPDARFGDVEELLAALLPFASAAPVFRDSLPPSSMPETSLTVEQEPMLDAGDGDRDGVGATQPPASSLTSFELDASKTLQSGSGARLGSRLLVTATQRSGAAPPLSRRKLALGVVGLAMLVGGVAALWSREPGVEPASSSLISIDSKPPGARVREGSVLLGLTPITISKGERTAGVRRFSLELDGYVSHTVTSAANAKGPQHISVTLVPLGVRPVSARAESREAAALPRAPASTAEQTPRVPASTAEQTPRAPRVPRSVPSGERLEPEIRMSR